MKPIKKEWQVQKLSALLNFQNTYATNFSGCNFVMKHISAVMFCNGEQTPIKGQVTKGIMTASKSSAY